MGANSNPPSAGGFGRCIPRGIGKNLFQDVTADTGMVWRSKRAQYRRLATVSIQPQKARKTAIFANDDRLHAEAAGSIECDVQRVIRVVVILVDIGQMSLAAFVDFGIASSRWPSQQQ